MKISIIAPIYKGSKDLDFFLEQIFLQTNKSYELILVADTNDENILSVIDKYKNKFKSKLKLIFNSKRISRNLAINQGIDVAIGEYSIILSLSNKFNKNLIEDILKIAKDKKTDIIEFNSCFINPIKFKGQIRIPFKDSVLIKENPKIHAFTYPFDFNKIFKTKILKKTSKFTFGVQDSSRYSIEITHKALLVSDTYSTINKNLVISNGKISRNFNPLKLIRQWESMIKIFAETRNDIEINKYFYAQYYFEIVFMVPMIKETKNKILLGKFDNKLKLQHEKVFINLFDKNDYANMLLKERDILKKGIDPKKRNKIYKELD